MNMGMPITTTADTPAASITDDDDAAKSNSNGRNTARHTTTKKTPLSRWVFGGGSTSKAQHDGAGTDRMPPHQQRLPSTFCATPKPTTSSTSCRTSSPSPRVREGEGVAPSPGFWVRRRSRRATVDRPSTPSGDLGPGGGSAVRQQMDTPSFAAIAEEQDSDNQVVVADAERKQQQEEQAGRSIWDEFDNSPWGGRAAAEGTGRELQRRKCVYKVFVVFRGDWCSTSAVLLKGFSSIGTSIRRSGGKVVAITSQTQEQAGRAAREWRVPFQVFGDPSNKYIKEMNRRFNMNCTITTNDMVTDAYQSGMAQPAVLAVYSDTVQDTSSVLFSWSRYQTIGSMRHDAVFENILRALSTKQNPRPNPSPTRPPLTPATVPPPPIGAGESAAPSGYGVRARLATSASPPIGRVAPRGIGGPAGVSRDVSRIMESPSGETIRWGYPESAAERTPYRASRQPRSAPRTTPRNGLRHVPPRATAVPSSTTNGEAYQEHQHQYSDHEQTSSLSVRRHRLSTPRNSGQRRGAMQAAVDGFGVEANERLPTFASNGGDGAAVVAREPQHAQQDRRPVPISRSVSPIHHQTTNTTVAGKVIPRDSAYSSSGGGSYTSDGGRFSSGGGGGYGNDDGRRDHKEQYAQHDRQQAQQQVAPAYGVSGRVPGPVTHRRLWPFGSSTGGTKSFADGSNQSKDSNGSKGRDISTGRAAVGAATTNQRWSTNDAGGAATAGYGRTARPVEPGIPDHATVGYGRATSPVDADRNSGNGTGYRVGGSGGGVSSDEVRRRRRMMDYRRRSSPPQPHHHKQQQQQQQGQDGGIWSKRSSSPSPALQESDPVEGGARPTSAPPFTRDGDDAGDGTVIRIRGGGLGQAGRRPVSMRWSLATNGVGTYAEPVHANGAGEGGNRIMSDGIKVDDME